MRKSLLVIALVTLVITGLFAQSITFWTTETESNRMQRIQALATIFQAKTGISVTIVPVQENDLFSRLAASKAAGTLPDVMEAGIEPLLLLGSEGLMDTQLNAKIINDFGDIYNGVKKLLYAGNGNYYGIPFHAWVQGIWYHKDWFKANDLGDPTTWYNILEAAKKLNDPSKGVYGIILPKKADSYAEQVFTEVALANGARPFDDNGNVTFDTPQMIQAFRFYKELGKYSMPGFTTVLDALKGYLSGKAGMIFYSTYIMDDIAIQDVQESRIHSFDPELVNKTGFANKMVNTDTSSYGQVVGLGILNSSKNKVAAEEFAKFLMTGDNYIYWLHMAPGGMNPTRRSIATNPKFLDNPVLKRYGAQKIANIIAALDSIERFDFYKGKVVTKMSKLSANFVIGKAINLMFANDWTPEQTAKWAQKEAERILSK
ncbi:ABC transporter substrate-binding protein [Mesoaciditoga lauensis]|uniref:ABC transporter substrate-binding protein n=1 Tax=Mesoaciditoga lauensis TaxID=1495039 RepID=UPI00056610C5|nr:extracellular solute-binding protein [Mesoaciditoga lauensis]